ncbi:MAG: lipopolysaccharide transport periplasmic protein LptA [Mariprofundaceae bacterium]|nr:lipopolysaccharide transport periplasmic protein LptA [Mariprofundaceae bacterium]
MKHKSRVPESLLILIRRIVMLALVIVFAGIYPAWAGPVTVQADHLDIWHGKKQALFAGNVHLKRDDFELFCDALRVFYAEKSGIERGVATGHVRMQQGDKHGHADKAELDNKHQILTLTGHAVMEQPGGRIEGATIIHHIQEKTTEVRRGKGGRVKLRIDADSTGKAPLESLP